MWLTGVADEAPRLPAADIVGPVRELLAGIAALWRRVEDVPDGRSGRPVRTLPGPPEILAGRAAEAGTHRHGRISVGGATRLLPTQDDRWLAVSLARPDDLDAIPAICGSVPGQDPWGALGAAALAMPANELLDRAQLLGVPAALLGTALPAGVPPLFSTSRIAEPAATALPAGRPWRVVDLSSMWAGPLCAHVLGCLGAEVVKVESWDRPDGARRGPAGFYDWLHAGHRTVAIDWGTKEGVDALRKLLATADVVIESSRARALDQIGVEPHAVGEQHPGLTWISVTAYGRSGPWRDRVGFGDDTAVAGGLVAHDDDGTPLFCADAIADPLAGICSAAAAVASMASGGGRLIEIPLARVAQTFASGPRMEPAHVVPTDDGWTVVGGGEPVPVVPPVCLPDVPTSAAAIGADNATHVVTG